MNILPRLVRAGFLSLSADLQYPGAERRHFPAAPPSSGQAPRPRLLPQRSGNAEGQAQMSAERQLEPGHQPPAAPPPPPPRRQPRNKLKPPAAFRIAARRTQLRRPRPGTIGDLDPDNAVPGPDRDRHRPPGSTRAAGPDRITEDLADQQDGRISARVPRAEYLTDERTGGPRPAPPARQASRSPGPSSPHPPFPGRPSPAALPRPPCPGKPAGQRADAETCTLSSAANVKPCTGPPPRTLVRGPSVVAAPVRGRPCKADGPSHRSLAPIPVRYTSVDTATGRPAALHDDTSRTKKKQPA